MVAVVVPSSCLNEDKSVIVQRAPSGDVDGVAHGELETYPWGEPFWSRARYPDAAAI